MAFEACVLLTGLVAGWLNRGSLWSIIHLRLRALWIAPIAFVLQHVSIAYLQGTAYEVLLVVSYVALLVFCALNLRTPGIVWAGLGTLANFVVMAFNHLRMPAYLPSAEKLFPNSIPELLKGEYGKSVAMTQHTHLNFLGDIFSFDIPPVSLISVGDVLFGIGLVLLIRYAMGLDRGRTS